MENQMQIFENKDFGKIRVIEKDGQPWFVGADVTKRLGYRNSRDAISKHIDDEDKGVANCDTLRGKQNLTIINESGLYSLIMSSKLPKARAFKRWITSEVLPSIRKHGIYISDAVLEEMAKNQEFTENLLTTLQAERMKKSALIERLEKTLPKAVYCDVVLQCPGAVQVSILAKDYGMSAVAFNKLLHGLKIQYKVGETWVLYKKYADKGYTVTRTYHVGEHTRRHSYLDGSKKLQKNLTDPQKTNGKGKQTVKQLTRQGVGVSNIEISDKNIKAFESVARKYGVDFALTKDTTEKPPKWLVFFKGRDADAITAAFKEFSANQLNRTAKKPSVIQELRNLMEKVANQVLDKTKNKDKGREH